MHHTRRGGGGGVHARESRREKPEGGGHECNVSYQLEGEEGERGGDRQE